MTFIIFICIPHNHYSSSDDVGIRPRYLVAHHRAKSLLLPIVHVINPWTKSCRKLALIFSNIRTRGICVPSNPRTFENISVGRIRDRKGKGDIRFCNKTRIMANTFRSFAAILREHCPQILILLARYHELRTIHGLRTMNNRLSRVAIRRTITNVFLNDFSKPSLPSSVPRHSLLRTLRMVEGNETSFKDGRRK